MSISLPPQQSGGVLPEYAATQSNTQRLVQKVDGVMVARFAGVLNYARTDYLLDGAGNKIAVIQPDSMPPVAGQPDPRYGSVSLTPEQLEAAFAADPALVAAFEKIASFEDSLIQADLVNRGII